MSHRYIATALTYLLLACWGAYSQGIPGEDSSHSERSCVFKAWVRAPNLAAGQIIAGDVKVKADGQCPEVAGYTLGLRFSERSWVKTRAKGVNLSEPLPAYNISSDHKNNSIFSMSLRWWSSGSDWEQRSKDLLNPALWLAQEEESIGFEARHALTKGNGSGPNIEQAFAVLVPNTNYPPAFDTRQNFYGGTLDAAQAEHIYAYFVDVHFANGTVREIPAGYTSFKSVSKPQSSASETINATAFPRVRTSGPGIHVSDNQDKFTLEITFPHGRNISQGSVNIVSVKSHQIGPGFRRPFAIGYRVGVLHKCEWSASYAVDEESANELRTNCFGGSHYQLLPKPEVTIREPDRSAYNGYQTTRLSQGGEVRNGTTFSSENIDMLFGISTNFFPTFKMRYQTVEVVLTMFLNLRDTMVEDDEYDWTPKTTKTTSAQVDIPLTVHPQIEGSAFEIPEGVHYLSTGARIPVFVDPSSVEQLLQKSAEDRDILAPLARARFKTFSAGDIVANRYYGNSRHQNDPPYYVGDAWLKKVLAEEDDEEYAHRFETALLSQV